MPPNPHLSANPTTAQEHRAQAALQRFIAEDYTAKKKLTLASEAFERARQYDLNAVSAESS